MHRAVLGLIALLVAASVGAPRARAGLHVCNTTTYRLATAVGRRDPASGWFSQGWWLIGPGDCRELISGPLSEHYYYLYAQGQGVYSKRIFTGRTPFCIQMTKFKLYQSQYGKNSKAQCVAAGLDGANFIQVDTHGNKNYSWRLFDSVNTQAGVPAPRPTPGGGQPAPVFTPGNRQPAPSPGSACQRFPNLC